MGGSGAVGWAGGRCGWVGLGVALVLVQGRCLGGRRFGRTWSGDAATTVPHADVPCHVMPCHAMLCCAEDIDFKYPMRQACVVEIDIFCRGLAHGHNRVGRCLQVRGQQRPAANCQLKLPAVVAPPSPFGLAVLGCTCIRTKPLLTFRPTTTNPHCRRTTWRMPTCLRSAACTSKTTRCSAAYAAPLYCCCRCVGQCTATLRCQQGNSVLPSLQSTLVG